MTDEERETLARRYVEIERKLLEVADGRTVIGDPADVEAQLLVELDDIAFRIGLPNILPRAAEQ